MATWDKALKDLNKGYTTGRASWNNENDFLEADHFGEEDGRETDERREWIAGEEPFAITRETDGEITPFEPSDEDMAATDWQEDEEDETPSGRSFNDHSNDIGDWCPWSMCTVTEKYDDDRCPAGCCGSRIVEVDA